MVESWHPNRFLALVLEATGSLVCFAKVGRGGKAENALRREAEILKELQAPLGERVAVPRVLEHDRGILVLEPIDWILGRRPHVLPLEVAEAMGHLWRDGRGLIKTGTSHGDFAPSNLLETRSGWIVVDWERATAELEPFADVSHYLVQSHAMLGKPSLTTLVQGVQGKGPLASTYATYARAAGLDAGDVRPCFEAYLCRSRVRREEGSRGHRVRSVLLELLT